jgi:cold shock CspA family protein
MQVPLELSFRGVERTAEREDLIYEKVEKLELVCKTITSCRVAVEQPQESQQTGNQLLLRVEVRIPRHNEVIVSQKVDADEAAEPFSRLVRQTFQTVQRQLREVTEKQRGQVKPVATVDEVAIVSKLFADRDYGFLETMDRREVYFHRHSVLNDDFDRLEIGTGVRFVEEEGDRGPQASTVAIIDKPGVSTPRAAAAED